MRFLYSGTPTGDLLAYFTIIDRELCSPPVGGKSIVWVMTRKSLVLDKKLCDVVFVGSEYTPASPICKSAVMRPW
jgi:hypothetical protein